MTDTDKHAVGRALKAAFLYRAAHELGIGHYIPAGSFLVDLTSDVER